MECKCAVNAMTANERAPGPHGDEQRKDQMSKQFRNDLKRGDAAGAPRIEWAPIATIHPNPKNARTHSRKQIRQIAAGIRKFGFLNPLIVDEGNMILAGRCHANLNLRREVRKSQLGLMLPSRLATSGTLRL
jgi:ParB-like nuclease domain